MPAAVEWFANIDNPRTRRAYQNDLEDFCSFVGLTGADEFRAAARAHVLAWRPAGNSASGRGHDLAQTGRAGQPVRSSPWRTMPLPVGNPVHGVKRPKIETNEGKTPALGDDQAKRLLDAPDTETVKGVRDRAISLYCCTTGFDGKRRQD